MSETLRTRMQRAVDDGRAAPLELALADWALRHHASAPVAAAFAACARAVADGHSCLDLDRADVAVPGEHPLWGRDDLETALANSTLVGAPDQSRPLIHDGNRLYLQRYWAYENRLAERLRELLATPPEHVDIDALLPDGGLFDYDLIGATETHWQAVAAFAAFRHRFAVISGGPGTGKTYTVLRLMRLLVESALNAGNPAPLIRLAAPTGKAAARMMESTRTGLEAMTLVDTVREHIPLEAKTLHRLIGTGYNSTQPRHNRDNPLAADVVLIDEASMVDLPMMAKLADAIRDDARLILLGDRYQLASVESGSVLAEICARASVNTFTAEQQTAAKPLLDNIKQETATNPLADHVVTLQTSRRFNADSVIGQLAACVNAGDADQALALASSDNEEVRFTETRDYSDAVRLMDTLAPRYKALIEATEPEAALAILSQHCILTAVRNGPFGSHTLNRGITERLAQQHDFNPAAHWYHGRPVIVTRNDYRTGLYNGDTGVCLRDTNGNLRVWFPGEQAPRPFLPSTLPEHDSVFAMTIHKSQGSEFDAVTLVLPDYDVPVLTRELLYTGLTRAKRHLALYAPAGILTATVQRQIERMSGLAERLGSGAAAGLTHDARPHRESRQSLY